MLEDNKNVVTEVTENVEEQATETLVDGSSVAETTETVEEKLYSEAELNEKVNKLLADKLGGKLAQQERRLRKEYDNKYGRLETVLKAGLMANGNKNVNSVEDITNTFDSFYKSKGIDIPEHSFSNEYDMEAGAEKEANEIINSGYEDLVEEVDRLADKGLNNMTAREKLVFTKLAAERTKQESIKELAKIGVKPEALNDSEYIEFANKLNPDLSAKEKYELYLKFKPKPKVEPVGSMKGATSKDNGVKDYYTYEESLRFTKADFDKNPELFKAVEKSMLKW
jgi:hypothetical protein